MKSSQKKKKNYSFIEKLIGILTSYYTEKINF